MSENSVTLVGRLTSDPELKFINSGQANAKFSIAVEKRWQNKQTQEWETRASFFNCVAWGKMGENVATSLKKGYRVVVTGTLEQRSWETDSGEKRTVVELNVDAVGPDLRFVTCELHKSESQSAPKSGGAATDEEDFF